MRGFGYVSTTLVRGPDTADQTTYTGKLRETVK